MDQQKPALTPQQQRLTGDTSAAQLYYKLICEDRPIWFFILFEVVTTLFGFISGILGLVLRALCYPALFKTCGKRPAFGRGVLIRNSSKISLGKKVLVDDFAALDVHGTDGSMQIGDYVSIGRFSTLAAKGGKISIANGANIGSYCRIATQSQVEIGESVLIGAYCYIGPGNHKQSDDGQPLISQEMEIKGGVKIGANAWLGTRVTVLDGVTIGEGAIIGAHSLVTRDIPAGATAFGTPAKVVKP